MRRYVRIVPDAGPEGGERDYNARMEGIQRRQQEAIRRKTDRAFTCSDCSVDVTYIRCSGQSFYDGGNNRVGGYNIVAGTRLCLDCERRRFESHES